MVIVLKYGGNAMRGPAAGDAWLDEVAERVASGDRIVLVHGGGPQIDAALAERGIGQRRVDGLRVTDAQTLNVTEAVLCATVNKALVRALLARGVRAAGISGEDAFLLVGKRIGPHSGESLGFVGEIAEVRLQLIEALFAGRLTPVVAPLAVTADGASALNVNADTAAGAIAGALRADAFVIVTNVERVRARAEDPASALEQLDVATAKRFLLSGTFDGGMKPKVESALAALQRGAQRVVICGSASGSIEGALRGEGTTFVTS